MHSYDRLFPNQDTMPRGGFGNLIALPLQHEPRPTVTAPAAQVLTAEQCLEDAVSRAYYAILHGAKAALHVHDVAVASHAGARRMAAEITAGHASQVDLPVAVHGSVANLRDFMGYREARRAQQTGLDFSVFLPLARRG
jgi:hypothetical protein